MASVIGPGFTSKVLFSTLTTGHLLGACLDWPMRVMAVVLAANVNTRNEVVGWPLHIYKLPGVIGTTVAYTMASITLTNVLTTKLVAEGMPVEELRASWTDFHMNRTRIFNRAVESPPDDAQILEWSTELVDVHRNFLARAVPAVKSTIYVTMLHPITSLASAAVIWPLRKVVTSMATQLNPSQISGPLSSKSLVQNPLTVIKQIIEQDGILRGFYSGFHLYALQAVLQLGINLTIGRVAAYGLDYLHEQIKKFMNYQQKHKKIYRLSGQTLADPSQVCSSLYMAAFSTIKLTAPILSIFTALSLSATAKAIAMPLSLLATMRCAQSSPLELAVKSSSFLRFGDMDVLRELLSEFYAHPLSSSLSRWASWHWKWFMLSAVFSPFGLSVSSDMELK
jgi:hypothetical protein